MAPPPPRSRHAPVAGILFAEDFDLADGPAHVVAAEEDEREPEVIVPSFSAEELAQAREEAFRDGEAAGRDAARAADDARCVAAIGEIARALQDAAAVAAAAADEAANTLATLLLAGFATLAPSVCARHGEDEVVAILRILLPALRTEPRIVIRLTPTLVDGVRARLEDLDPELLGRIEMVSAAIPQGDLQVSWRNGEAVRDTAAILRRIGTALAPLALPALRPETIMEPDDAERHAVE